MPSGAQQTKAELSSDSILEACILRQVRETRRSGCRGPLTVLIGGGWSAGKSTMAVRLAAQLGVANVVHSDVVRSVLRQCMGAEQREALMPSTYETWKLSESTYSQRALAEGFRRQCNAVAPAIHHCLREAIDFGKDTVVEGMHLHPAIYAPAAEEGKHLFLWLVCGTSSLPARIVERCHTTYLGRPPQRYMEQARFRKIADLNLLLAAEAERNRVPVLDLSSERDMTTLSKLFAQYVDEIAGESKRPEIAARDGEPPCREVSTDEYRD